MKALLFRFKNQYLDATVFRYLVVGIINTIFGTTIMFLLYNIANCSYWISTAANYFFGSILSFFLNKYFTFRHHGQIKQTAIRFTINILLCYLFAYGIAKPLAHQLFSFLPIRWCENIAMLIGMTLFVIFNYFGQRFFAFRDNK